MEHRPQHGASSQETPRRTQQTPLPPPKDSLPEVRLVAAILLGLVLAIGGIWMYQEWAEEAPTAKRAAASQRIPRQAKAVTTSAPASKKESARAASVAAGGGAVRPSPVPASGDFDVFFNVGQDSLTAEAKALLAEQAPRMAGHKKISVLLHGHTDRRGSAAANEALGRQRARAVETELVQLGVPKTAIQVFSQGEQHTLCRSKTEACHRKNRRVHISWKATSNLTSVSSGTGPMSEPPREGRRVAAGERAGAKTPKQAPVRAAQATPK